MGLISFSEKVLVFLATVGVVVGLIILIDGWRNDHLYVFFFTGQWENLFYLVAFAFCMGFLLKKLAQMQFHNLFVARRRR